MKNSARRRMVSAVVVVALLTSFASTAAQADTADADTAGSGVTRAMFQEHQMLRSDSGARIAELSGIARPKAREEAESTVTVASRSVEGLTAATAPRTPTKLDFAVLDAMPSAGGNAEWHCLAQAIYFEARGEPLAGQIAVAEVVLNRRDAQGFPNSVCGVTNQGCQFSYVCDGISDTMKSSLARQRSEKLASLMLSGHERKLTDGALYFHTPAVRPSWSRKFTRTTKIGYHIFYRPATRVAGG